jgi:hypothetical protein
LGALVGPGATAAKAPGTICVVFLDPPACHACIRAKARVKAIVEGWPAVEPVVLLAADPKGFELFQALAGRPAETGP